MTSWNANILFDEGSQQTFIMARLASLLRLKSVHRAYFTLSGFKGLMKGSNVTGYYIVVELWNSGIDGERIQILATVLESIVDSLDEPFRQIISTLPHLKKLRLAYSSSAKINFDVDILLGALFF